MVVCHRAWLSTMEGNRVEHPKLKMLLYHENHCSPGLPRQKRANADGTVGLRMFV